MKRMLVSPLTGRIHYATVRELSSGNYQLTGERVDVTDEAVKAVFEWFMNHLKEEGGEAYNIRYEGVPYVLEMRKIDANQSE